TPGCLLPAWAAYSGSIPSILLTLDRRRAASGTTPGRRRRCRLSTASWPRTKTGWGGYYQEKVVACNQPVFKHLALVRGLGQPLRAESAFRCNAEQFPPGVRWAIHVSPPQEGGYPQKLRIRVRCRSLWA